MKEQETKGFYDFKDFRLDTASHLLYHAGEIVPLTPKEYDVLFVLITSGGRVVSKDELLEAVWQDAYVEEGTLTRNVSWLRKKLAARTSDEKFIETLPKRGYRFLPPVAWESAAKISADRESARTELGAAKVEPYRTATVMDSVERVSEARLLPIKKTAGKKIFPVLGLFLVAGLALICLAAYKINFGQPKVLLVGKPVPFSGLPGYEDMPSFSPDGKQLAFAWDGNRDNGKRNIYVKPIGAGEPLRLTNGGNDGEDLNPVFSPDGRFVAFARQFGARSEIMLISSLGGAERKISELNHAAPTIVFSPDGSSLVITDSDANDKNSDFYSIIIETGEKQKLVNIEDNAERMMPRFSPDGMRIAFLKAVGNKALEICIVPVTGGVPKRLTFDESYIDSLAWSADGEKILFISKRTNNQLNLWRVAIRGGEPELISTGGSNIRNLAISPNSKAIAFVETAEDTNIWQIDANQPVKKIIASAQNDHSQQFSPDGARLTFVSNRSGNDEIWTADTDGKNQRQLTESNGSAGSPRFSPDGNLIAYDVQTDVSADVFVISATGGEPNRLTDGKFQNSLPSWSRDGRTVYFRSNRGASDQLYKITADGSAAPIQITTNGAFESFAGPDERTVYYSKNGVNGLWSVDTNGGEELPVPELSDAGYWRSWTLTPLGIYYAAQNSSADAAFQIKFYDFGIKQIRLVTTVEKSPLDYYSGLSVSANGKQILYAQSDRRQSQIRIAELP